MMMIWLMIHLAPAKGRLIAEKGVGLSVQMLELHKAWLIVLMAMHVLSLAMHSMHISATCWTSIHLASEEVSC